MKTSKTKQLSLLLMMSLSIVACKKDVDPIEIPVPENDPELITTIQLQFTDSSNSSNKILVQFKDPDGDGGNSPVQFDSLKLPANKTWYCETTLLNESVSPTINISEEVSEEANDHLFVYTPQGVNMNIQITDKDANNLPIGLKSTWRTSNASSGTIKVVLKHQPGVKNGTEAPGETDVEVLFKGRIY